MITTVGFILIVVLLTVIVWGKTALAPVLITLPVIAALICGFSVKDIIGFINMGLGGVLTVVVLFAFAIIYFNVLNDIGMFDLLIQKIMKNMRNRAEIVMIITAIIAAIAHLDGSGATTMIITIPAMLPIYKKMKLSPLLLLLIISISSGIMNMNPWCPPALALASSIQADTALIMRSLLPIQLFGAALLIVFIFFIGRLERKKSGIGDEEFMQLKKDLAKPVEIKVPTPIFIFDIVFTVVLIAAMLLSWAPPHICFVIALSIILLINFKGAKAQTEAIRRHGATAINMVLIMMAIGVLTGIMQNSGMFKGMTQAILGFLPESLGIHLVFIVSLISPLLGIVLGNAATTTAIAPVLAGVIVNYGASITQLSVAIITGVSLAANLSFVGAGPYLALGLADVEMGNHIKYSFKWVILFNVIMSAFAAVIGVIPF
jgi:CitMHS family citrate-Mg2+:H+ or citrate-Ca2+:H+ symporter